MEIEHLVHVLCKLLRRIFPHFKIRAHDINRDIICLYYCVRWCYGDALHPATIAQGVSRAIFSVVSIFGNFGVFGHDDIA